MIYLILSILCSTAIVLLFKMLGVAKIQVFPTICLNYVVCVLCAWFTEGQLPLNQSSIQEPWFPYALFLGVIFITGFNITAMTVQIFSVTVAAVMQKMSLVLTVLYTIIFYQEAVNFLKVTGILLALLAIILINWPEQQTAEAKKFKKWYWYLFPAYTLLSSALVEIIFFKVEKITGNGADLGFIALIFGIAGLLGNIVLILGVIRGKIRFGWKEVVTGITLGVINFGSIFYLLKVIGVGWEGSVVFPINNVSIITISTILAIILFKEKLLKINSLGLACAVVAIAFIALS